MSKNNECFSLQKIRLSSFTGCQCGGPFPSPFSAPRIIGGQVVAQNSIPYQVALVRTTGSLFCGGSLISPNYVLTAAHCVLGPTKSPDSFVAVVGLFNLSQSISRSNIFNISSILPHPQYDVVNASLGMIDHDYAILGLSTPVAISSFNGAVGLVCLPPFDGSLYDGATLIVSGWGYTTCNPPLSVVLKATTLTGITWQVCNITDSTDVFCAIDPTAQSMPFSGDSGGDFLTFIEHLTIIK